jgi:renalase
MIWVMLNDKPRNIAIVGAGLAGATCARTLMLAGHTVHVVDKSRGPGGRLSTRRAEWLDAQGQSHLTHLDHGALGLTARSEAFQAFLGQGVRAGCLAPWLPTLRAQSLPPERGAQWWVCTPDMPELCRRLLVGAVTRWSWGVDALHKGPAGWQLRSGGDLHSALFDAVVLALPPAQAAPLLSPHQRTWARQASVVPMQPCWTLMGVADAPDPALAWDLAQPQTGPLAWAMRNDTRPGRAPVAGQAHWVAHAKYAWSREHLEQPAAWVQQQLDDALAALLGQRVDWQFATVHRWRYAVPPPHVDPPTSCWWNAAQGLGVCGDFLAGSGAEAAWLSAQSLCTALLQRPPDAPGDAAWFCAHTPATSIF